VFLKEIWQRFNGRRISIYADFIDPFCYIGFQTLRHLAEAKKLTLDWRGFELNPGTPPEGLPLTTAANSDLRPGMWASVNALADRAGLSFPEPRFVPNTRAAHFLVNWVKKPAVKNPLIDRIYQAYFIGQRDIGQIEVLIELASHFDISAEQVQAAAGDVHAGAALKANRADAEKRRFTGLPGFVFRDRTYFGALSRQAWEEIFRGGRGGHQNAS